ncbi:cAMP-regulated D2 protein-like [Mercenaria mercenaria]|uniref:cAMP-regulated D2 protein-like n=1 Tax=Mercenaria mercenaria TaxID=6596 RepID=UPI00234F8E46|nr:cAMP-regulated D2 protein-like [Mercenaria mercenaria]
MFRYLYSLIISLAAFFTNDDVVVQTKYGKIQGVQTSKSRAFLGVPYAAPPVGEMRWRPPEHPSPWSGILDATAVKAGCYQLACASMNPPILCPKQVSEDCLYLNIWTPVNASAESRLPVMVFIHGGNFVHLSGGSLLFRGEDFVSKGQVILVNVDYRLGAFGFLVTGDKAEDAKGNYGIKDQRMALQWVQENIKTFGGDPTKVTLFGQSAGAQSTAIHLSNGKANGLFRNAIVESAPFDIRYKTKEEVLLLGDFIAEFVNCTGADITCLRTRSAADIALAEHEVRSVITSPFLLELFEPIGPWIDGDEVKMEPIDSAHKGQFQNIPILMGTLSEETRIFVYEAWKKPLRLQTYLGIVLLADPKKSLQILDKYPPNKSTDCRDTLQELATDLIFTCTARNVTQSLQTFTLVIVFIHF